MDTQNQNAPTENPSKTPSLPSDEKATQNIDVVSSDSKPKVNPFANFIEEEDDSNTLIKLYFIYLNYTLFKL